MLFFETQCILTKCDNDKENINSINYAFIIQSYKGLWVDNQLLAMHTVRSFCLQKVASILTQF